jgi:polyisoprenoid-binding protein YceI
MAGTWDIDPVHSHIGFMARHMMLSKVRGRFDVFEGQIITGEDPFSSSVAVTVDLNSVNTGNEVRDNDLRSDNFFDVANYPTMTYRSTGVRRAGEDFFLDGQLTVRGVTRPVSLRFEVNGFAADPEGVTRAPFSAAGEINRWNSASAPTRRSRAWPAKRSISTSRLGQCVLSPTRTASAAAPG